jgi:hypothetical protein
MKCDIESVAERTGKYLGTGEIDGGARRTE